jgi:hypothetical protein
MKQVFLLDVDSVLVEATGYLTALRDTVAHFSLLMGVGEHTPTETEVREFEALGLTSEWDSGTLCVAALLLERTCAGCHQTRYTGFEQLLSTLARNPYAIRRPPFTTIARGAGQRMRHRGMGFAEAAQAALAEILPSAHEQAPSHAQVLQATSVLLHSTHDFYASPVTRYFQHLAIGSDLIRETYGVSPDFVSDAYLAKFDSPLLSTDVRGKLLRQVRRGRARAAIYTARPSLPPTNAPGVEREGYSPEAEFAQTLVGLGELPMIGLGGLQWLAHTVNADVRRLVKPSCVQALAAMAAAWSADERASLLAAYELEQGNTLAWPLTELDGTIVHVFEDSLGGIEAVDHATHLLRRTGTHVSCRAYGIAPAAGPKTTAMASKHIQTFRRVDEAIGAALTAHAASAS